MAEHALCGAVYLKIMGIRLRDLMWPHYGFGEVAEHFMLCLHF